MTKEERYEAVLSYFRREMPVVETELHFADHFQLLVAVILSAQCTDKRVNLVTPALFAHYPDARSMAAAEPDDLLEWMGSVSYPNSKARHLIGMARMIDEEFNGQVPQDMEQLLRLPGVGRKTANVVQAVAFGQATMAVDTHVYRVSHRLGLVPPSATTPLKVEQELVRRIPEADIPRAHHWLLLHGRYTCTAQRPHCDRCAFAGLCPSRL